MSPRHLISTVVLAGMLAGILVLSALSGSAHAEGKFKVHTIDVGTGTGVYIEVPSVPGEDRPYRIIYDTGKGRNDGLDSDLVSFLASGKIGLKTREGDFGGDVIDYFIISHPHEDHFNGAKPVFDLFDVRNVIESKQLHSSRYLMRFKSPAVNEIMGARAAEKDAHFYVVGLPYPNGFDQARTGEAYDEYALCASNLPEFMKGVVDPSRFKGQVHWPFGPDQVAQTVNWPVPHLVGESAEGLAAVNPQYREKSLPVDVIPLGTRFELGRDGNFTIVHADSIAALNHTLQDSETYSKAWPYYRGEDLNDGSVSIQVQYKNASVFIPGDTEGRHSKPETKFSLEDIFGGENPEDSYTENDIMEWLRWSKPVEEQLPLLGFAMNYIHSSFDIRRLGYYAYVTFDRLTPSPFEVNLEGGAFPISAKSFDSPANLDPEMVYWDSRSELQKKSLHPQWSSRLHALYTDLGINKQKLAALRTRFTGWIRGGSKARLVYDAESARFKPNWTDPIWTVVNLVQLTERLYYVDPGLAQIFAGLILSSEPFLDYMSPADPNNRALRGERHMIDVADTILAEGGPDVLKSDVLLFGHHGSFTSSSIDFVHRVDPNVGIISADDKSYSGSTLPDFSALFWNLNSKHPKARAILHSIFFHADVLHWKRKRPIDNRDLEKRFSPAASRVFRARGRSPIPLWRTDWNDDMVDKNTLVDNILIESDGSKPIWDWSRIIGHDAEMADPNARQVLEGLSANPERYPYWSLELISARPLGAGTVDPIDPSGQISTYSIGTRMDSGRIEELDEGFGPDAYRDGSDEEEDWVRNLRH